MEIVTPEDVRNWVRAVFADCNKRTSAKMMKLPSMHEESLDFTFIEQATQYSAPMRFPSDWVVRIDTHYLGGRRHFYNWEIADLGILLVFRKSGKLVLNKVALLQSKRLYPNEQALDEAEPIDYEMGFGRLFPGDTSFEAVTSSRCFSFKENSSYKALIVGDKQWEAIKRYERKYHIPIYYLLHHPWTIPFSRVVPVVQSLEPEGEVQVGCRVLPGKVVRRVLKEKKKAYTPRFKDFKSLVPRPYSPSKDSPGWKIEEFIADLVLNCRTGYIAKSQNDDGLFQVFNRRTGPIAAAISITFDAP